MPTTISVTVDRTGPAIRAALAAHAPEDEAAFVTELRDALRRASDDLDLSVAQAVLRRWQARALMAANPLTSDERAQLERARTGDFTGFSVRHPDGTSSLL
jgi:Family of unknown function (DUF6247)